MGTKLLYTFFLFTLALTNITYGQNCISNVNIEQEDCNPFGNYIAFVSFDHSPNVDSVSLFFDGEFFGNHSTEFQPIVLAELPFNTNGNNTHSIELVSTASATCRDTTSFEAVCNFGSDDCLSEIFFVDAFCIDSTLQFEVNYTFLNPVSEGHIYVNDEFIANATIGENQSLIFSVDNINLQSVYEIAVRDAEFPTCGDTLTTQVAPCTENCTANFDIATTCNNDGTFELSFFHQDSFTTKLYLNDEFISLITPGQTSNPFLIEDILVDPTQSNFTITSCLESNPTCCRTVTFEQPACESCNINLTLNEVSCEGFAPVFDISYDYTNPVSGGQIFVNGSLVQDAETGLNNTVVLNPQILNEQGTYIVTLQDSLNQSCADTLIINDFFCDQCIVETSNLITECLAGTDNYLVEIDIFNSGTTQVFEYFIIHQTGETFGPFSNIGNNGAVQASFEASTNLQGQFQVFDANGICTAFFDTQVNCNPDTDCSITNILLDHACLDTNMFEAFIRFEHSNVQGGNVEILDLNGLSLGLFDVNQQPIIIQIPTSIQGIEPFGISIFNPLDSNCIAESNIIGIDCGIAPSCSISNVSLDFECLDENNYQVFLTFNHSGVEGDTIVVNDVNGNLVGFFDVNQQPIVIDVNNTNGNNNSFGVFIENPRDPECSAGSSLIQVDCGTTDPCEIAFIEVLNTECNPDGTYNLTVNYNINIQSVMEITVNVNGTDFDVVPNPNLVFTIEGITPSANSNEDLITICSQEFMNCCNEIEFPQPDCMVNEDCVITGIEYEAVCLDSAELFVVDLFFTHESTSGSVLVTDFSGSSLGQFNVDDQPLRVGPFTQDDLDNNGIGFIICDAQIDGCCAEVFATNVDCEPVVEPCAIEFIEVISTECNPSGTYDLTVTYNITNGNNDFVDVTVNNGVVQSFDNIGTVVVTNVTPRPNSDFDIIEICLNDNADCCQVNEYLQPDCSIDEDCAIGGLEYEAICLDSAGTFMINLFFNQANTSGEVTVTTFTGEILGQFGAGQQPIQVGPFSQDDINDDGIGFIVCDAQIDGCCAEVFATNIPCMIGTEPCAIEFIEFISTECNSDSTYNLTVEYNIINGNNDFIDVSINGGAVQSFDNTGSLVVSNIIPRANADFDIVEICVADNPMCCQVIEYQQPVCTSNPQECEIEILDVDFFCDGENDEEIFFTLNVESNTMNDYTIFVNGVELGIGNPANLDMEVGPFATNNDGFYMIQVIDTDNATCRANFELLQAFCPEEGCAIGDLEVVIECLDEETFTAIITFPYDANHQDGITIRGNGTDYGTFDGFTQPIFIESLVASDNDNWEFVVIDNQDDACQSSVEVGEVNCSDENLECIIENIEVFNLECIGDNEYAMSVSFETGTNANIPFSFFVNGVPMNAATTNSLPLNVFGVVPNDTSAVDVITICLDDLDGECCVDFAYDQPSCLFSSVDATLIDGVSMSPNPTSEMLYINDIPNDIIGLNVIDNLGRKIEQISSQHNVQLDVSSYQNGIYMIQFFTQDNRVMSRRFVKM